MNKLEEKILSSLEAIGYNGPLLQKPNFPQAIEGGPKSIEYTKLVHFLTNEIRTLSEIDEEVNEIISPEDAVAFIMELTSFLKELNCPYKSLMEGHVSERLQNVADRLLLLDYLISELMAARILQEKRPSKKIELKLQETPEAKDMRLILQTLRFPKPPSNISITTLFQKLIPTIPIVVNKAGMDIIGRGIFNGTLSPKQWEILNGVQEEMHKEYKIRREMLLTRLDVTIQSFQWSNRTMGKDDVFEKLYHDRRKFLKVDPDVDIADLVAARTDIAIIEKTSSSSVRRNTRSSINKVVIGGVPDRGGRTSEIAPPPPEMPSWQQRSGPGGGRGGGFGGRGGGNFNRGGGGNFNRGGNFSQGGGNNYSRDNNNYASGGSNYQGGGGNFQSGGGNFQSGGGNFQSGGGNFQSGGGNFQSGRGGYQSGNNYQSGQGRGGYGDNRNFDSAGSYSSPSGGYGGGSGSRGYDSFQGKSSSPIYSKTYDQSSFGGNKSYSDSRRDIGGSFSSYSSNNSGGSKSSFDSRRDTGLSNFSSFGGGISSLDSRRDSGYDRRDIRDSLSKFGSSSLNTGGSFSSLDSHQSKRPKMFDSFQANKTTYADQYVQERQQNQQYSSRDDRDRGGSRSAGGRSNYQRGGRTGSSYR